MTQDLPPGHAVLRDLGDRMDNAQIGASARYWGLCMKQEKGEHPSADKRVLVALTGRRVVMLMFGVLLQELTRTPGVFTTMVAALANGMVREVGANLSQFPFEERVRAYEGLSRQLAEGLEIALTPWQAIETAPQDGTKVDLWAHWPEHDRWERTADAYWSAEDGNWKSGDFHFGQYMFKPTVTHWMPAPAGPPATVVGG